MICKQCGAEVPDDHKFCIKCGNDLEKQREEERAAQAANSQGDSLHCPKCGAPIHAGDKFCTGCGADLSIKETPSPELSEPESIPDEFHCPHCGAEIKPGDKFCIVCGKPLVAEEPAPATDSPAQPQNAAKLQAPVQQPDAVQSQIPVQPTPAQQQYNQQQYGQQQYAQQQYAQQPNTFYAEAQPQYQQAPPAQAKKPKSKTPAWVWVLIALLAVAIIFCIVWFFVLPDRHNTTDNSAVSSSQTQVADGQVGQAAGSGEPARVYVNQDSEYSSKAESDLAYLATNTIQKATKDWHDKSLMGDCYIYETVWQGNSLIFIVEVNVDYSEYGTPSVDYYDHYYTYVKYNNVYTTDGGNTFECESQKRPKGRKLNLFKDNHNHFVAGYAQPEEAEDAAGI